MPLAVEGRPRGVLVAASVAPDQFNARDLAFLEAVSSWIGLLAHRAELIERLVESAERLGARRAAGEITRLTPRQREVARLVAAGLTNEEIAQRLVLERGTVSNHVLAILERLGFQRRTQVAAWAAASGLYQLDAHDLGPAGC